MAKFWAFLKKVFSTIGSWFTWVWTNRSKIWAWIKQFKWVFLLIGGVILGVFLSRKLAQIVAKVQKPTTWKPIPGQPNLIQVKDEEGLWVAAELPQGITSDHVVAAGVATVDGSKIEIEVQWTPPKHD